MNPQPEPPPSPSTKPSLADSCAYALIAAGDLMNTLTPILQATAEMVMSRIGVQEPKGNSAAPTNEKPTNNGKPTPSERTPWAETFSGS